MSAYRSMALAAMAFIVTGCFGSGGPAATPRASHDGSPVPAATPQLLDPIGWPDDMPQACWLLQPAWLEEELGMDADEGANPFSITSEEANVTVPLKNACRWEEALFGDWTASEMVLVIFTPLESEFIAGEWERNETRHYTNLEIAQTSELPRVPDIWISRAMFDPGTSEQPTSIALEDGSRAIGARATLYVEVGELWLSLQPSGEAAVRPTVRTDILRLAHRAVNRLVGMVYPG